MEKARWGKRKTTEGYCSVKASSGLYLGRKLGVRGKEDGQKERKKYCKPGLKAMGYCTDSN